MVKISDLINSNIIYAKRGKTITKDMIETGNIPVIAGGQSSPYFHNKATHENNVITVSASGAYSGFVWYHDYPIWASDCSVFYSKDETKILTKYLYHILKYKQEIIYKMQNGAGQSHVYIKDIETLYFPLSYLSEQQKLVDDALDKIQSSIQSAKDLIESLKSQKKKKKGGYLFYLGIKRLSLLNLKSVLKKLMINLSKFKKEMFYQVVYVQLYHRKIKHVLVFQI